MKIKLQRRRGFASLVGALAATLALAMPLQAQDCGDLSDFQGLVSAAESALGPNPSADQATIHALLALAATIDLSTLENRISNRMSAADTLRAREFVVSTRIIADVGRQLGPSAATTTSRGPGYQAELVAMRYLIRDICTPTDDEASPPSPERGEVSRFFGKLGLRLTDGIERTISEIAKPQSLAWLFAGLSAMLFAVFGVQIVLDWSFAKRNRRQKVHVPATLVVDDMDLFGAVVIIGKRGCRFQHDNPRMALGEHDYPVGTPAMIRFPSAVYQSSLLSHGDGQNGFLFARPLTDDMLENVVRNSTVKPRPAADRGPPGRARYFRLSKS